MSQSISSTRWMLASLSLCMLLPSLGTSSANVALPSLVQGLVPNSSRKHCRSH